MASQKVRSPASGRTPRALPSGRAPSAYHMHGHPPMPANAPPVVINLSQTLGRQHEIVANPAHPGVGGGPSLMPGSISQADFPAAQDFVLPRRNFTAISQWLSTNEVLSWNEAQAGNAPEEHKLHPQWIRERFPTPKRRSYRAKPFMARQLPTARGYRAGSRSCP
jgi:hypothetical protein